MLQSWHSNESAQQTWPEKPTVLSSCLGAGNTCELAWGLWHHMGGSQQTWTFEHVSPASPGNSTLICILLHKPSHTYCRLEHKSSCASMHTSMQSIQKGTQAPPSAVCGTWESGSLNMQWLQHFCAASLLVCLRQCQAPCCPICTSCSKPNTYTLMTTETL